MKGCDPNRSDAETRLHRKARSNYAGRVVRSRQGRRSHEVPPPRDDKLAYFTALLRAATLSVRSQVNVSRSSTLPK
jgi:hypothetical protein